MTKQEGKTYHVGEPISGGRHPDERGKGKPLGAKKGWKPKRGGKIWIRPHPKQGWMGKAKFEIYKKAATEKTKRKLELVGLSGGQFIAMAEKAQIPLPNGVKGRAKASKPAIQKIVRPYVIGKVSGKRYDRQILLQSDGLEISGVVNAQKVLMIATSNRTKYFIDNLNRNMNKEIKKWMPKSIHCNSIDGQVFIQNRCTAA